MCENNGFGKLAIKGFLLVIVGLAGIFCPLELTSVFKAPLVMSLRVYHVLWFFCVLVLVKRMIPAANAKMSSGKMFRKNFVATASETEGRRRFFAELKKRTDSGAARSALYWVLLLCVMWMWRISGILPDKWILIIVLFFVFMDQFCISVFCPFQWLMKNKCCSTCRINNWGYLMAFSPLVFIVSFWTYSILLLSVATVIQWEWAYFRHPERFYDISNANLMCKNCPKPCKRRGRKSIE